MNKKLLKELKDLTIPKPVNLFPTTFFVLANKAHTKNNESLMKSIKNYRIKNKRGLKKSNYGGYHSEQNIQHLDKFKTITLKLIHSYAAIVSMYFGRECIKNTENYKCIKGTLESMWFMVNGKGHANTIHSHPRAWMACSYYISLPKGNNYIYFHDPIQARKQDADYAKCTSVVEIQEGDAIFFPGWFEHSVPPNLSKKNRVVISCNFRKPSFISKIKEKADG